MADLQAECPGVGFDLIQQLLASLQKDKKVIGIVKLTVKLGIEMAPSHAPFSFNPVEKEQLKDAVGRDCTPKPLVLRLCFSKVGGQTSR